MVSSRVAGAGARSGVPVATVSTASALLQRAAAEQPRLVVLDLSLPGLNPSELVPQLKSLSPAPWVVAFGPHVQEARLEAAAQAGCDAVLARGQFHAQIDELLAQFAV